jgi:hypothetical protein
MGSGRSLRWGLVALVAGTGFGCDGISGHHAGGAGRGGGSGGMSGSVGAGVAGTTGSGVAGTTGSGVAGTTGSGVAGAGASDPGGAGGSLGGAGGLAGQGGVAMPSTRVGDCGATLALSSDMRLAPAATGQRYLRCGTIGPERDWKIVLSGDGRRLAALTAAGTVRLYATDDNWRELGQLAAPLGRWDAAAFSPDNTRLATLSAEIGEVTLWNAANGSLVRSFSGPAGSTIDSIASSLAFSADGKKVATSLGTIIDIASSTHRSGLTGGPVNVARSVNPQNLGTGEAVARLRYVAGQTRLFADVRFQIGNSPPSERIELRDPASGNATVLFNMFDRALTGFAVSPDGNLVAISTTDEAQVSGLTTGLFVVRAGTGAVAVSTATFTDAVLGFSADSTLLFTRNGDTIAARNAETLAVVRSITLPAGAVFLGVAPSGRIVTAEPAAGTTSWRDPVTGAVAQTLAVALDNAVWAAGGGFGAGTSASDGLLFHMWAEPDVTQLCAPQGADAPAAIVTTGASPDAQWLALGRADGVVDIATAGTANDAISSSVPTQLGSLATVDLSAGAARLAAMAAMAVPNVGRPLQVFEVPSAVPLLSQVSGAGDRIALSPDGLSLAFAAGDVFSASVQAIDVDSGATRLTVTGAIGVRPDRFSPDSARLGVVTGSGVAAWRLADQMLDATYPGGGRSVFNAAMSPDWSVVAGILTPAQTFGEWRTSDGVQVLNLPNAFNSPGVAGLSTNGGIVGARLFTLHTHSTDFSAIAVVDVATSQTMRLFGAASTGAPASRQLQIGPGGDRLYTLESPVVAVWCR